MNNSPKTLKELAKEALNVQDACNLSGVVHSFSKAISELRELYPEEGTKFINEHPICILWSDKIAHLTKTQGNSKLIISAYDKVMRIAKGEDNSERC